MFEECSRSPWAQPHWIGRDGNIWGSDFPWKKAGGMDFIIDPNGNMHSSVEEAFLDYRLRTCECLDRIEVLRTCYAFLTMVDLGVLDSDRQFVIDKLFEGTAGFCDLYANCMEGLGLTIHNHGDHPGPFKPTVLTDEGKGALEMLQRSTWFGAKPPGIVDARVPEVAASALILPAPLQSGEVDVSRVKLELEKIRAHPATVRRNRMMHADSVV